MATGRDPDRDAKELEAELAIAAPRVEALLALADKVDAEKVELAKSLEGDVAQAVAHVRRGELLRAASLFEAVADKYRARCFIADSDALLQRARDARAAHRLKLRQAKKGKGAR